MLEQLVYQYWPLLLLVGGAALALLVLVFFLLRPAESEFIMESRPSERTEEEIAGNEEAETEESTADEEQDEPAATDEDDSVAEEEEPEEDPYPLCQFDIYRWKDKAHTIVEHIVVECASITEWGFFSGNLTLTWQDDGIVNIDSDQPAPEGDEELDSDGDEKRRTFTRVFFWTKKLVEEEPDTSDDEPNSDWQPEHVIQITLENRRIFIIEADTYDSLEGVDPDVTFESASNGIIRMRDSETGEILIDTDDVDLVIGFSFIENFQLD